MIVPTREISFLILKCILKFNDKNNCISQNKSQNMSRVFQSTSKKTTQFGPIFLKHYFLFPRGFKVECFCLVFIEILENDFYSEVTTL